MWSRPPSADPTRRRSSTSHRQDLAVSTVIGTVLMVGITVTVFSGVAVVIFNEVNDGPDSQTAELSALARGTDALIITHNGGEALTLGGGELQMTVDGVDVTLPLTALASQTTDGTSWTIGQTLCIVGSDTACLYPPGTDVSRVYVVVGNAIILSHGDLAGGGTGGGGGGGGGGDGGADPGHAYEDANGNGVFDAGDTALDYDDIKNGYDAGADALVVSASTNGGALEPDSNAVWSADGGITFHASVIADGNQALTFVSANGDVVMDAGLTVETNSGSRDIVIDAGGDVIMDGVSIDAGNGFIRIGNSAYVSGGYVGGDVSLVGATLEARDEISIKAAGDIDVQDAVLRQGTNNSAKILLEMDDTSDTIYLSGSKFMRVNSDSAIDVDLEPDHASGHVDGTPTTYKDYT